MTVIPRGYKKQRLCKIWEQTRCIMEEMQIGNWAFPLLLLSLSSYLLFNPSLRKEQSNLISYKNNRMFIQKLRWELSICHYKPLNSLAYIDFYRRSLVLLGCLSTLNKRWNLTCGSFASKAVFWPILKNFGKGELKILQNRSKKPLWGQKDDDIPQVR